MPVLEQPKASNDVALFRNLRTYSATGVAALNACRRLFAEAKSWETWIREVFAELLEVPAGLRLEISQSNEVGGEQTQKYVFEQNEILIGRIPENDISLSLSAISRRHARIFVRSGDYYVEDLQSGTGTYLNRRKLNAGHPQPLASGDEVLIFPYEFRFEPKEVWVRDEGVAVSCSSRLTCTTAPRFAAGLGSDVCLFQIELHPEFGRAILAVPRQFLKTILSRLLRGTVSELVELDLGLFEFVVVSVLERANRELRFPFQFFLKTCDRLGLEDEPGMALDLSVRLTDSSGGIKAFLPFAALAKLEQGMPLGLPVSVREQLSWPVTVRCGFSDIASSDLAVLEPGDILIYLPANELVLPDTPSSQSPERGWQVARVDDDPYRLQIETFFERIPVMESSTNSTEPKTEQDVVTKPELSALPVRVHVVLSHVNLSLGELEGLAEGSVIELDCEKTGHVHLAANGSVLGAGELVDVEGRLGVQITRWGSD
ncbi:MAG TPA: type III secretion system cytoplasmic ring protein SctQ [Bryobacteraceae bacterium]|jgi:flagellar motor switch/type III secretory pathway protein FliN/pSer/pThr/pTyr-binding forkhead associated (FHA) protein|nr:type III secretion system cytoplasmic ring protein SctQ [Bryobacteraceae bacterium]